MKTENDMRPAAVSKNSTAWQRIAADLSHKVENGVWLSGESLPPALEMARQYGVHRHTVRQAYKHLQDIGVVQIQRGLGTFVCGGPLTYKIGRRVSFRDNMKAIKLQAVSSVMHIHIVPASPHIAEALNMVRDEPLWQVELLNQAGKTAVSLSQHFLVVHQFPDFPKAITDGDVSLSAAFKTYGIETYERLSTRISARLASTGESDRLSLAAGSAVLVTQSIDAAGQRPLQFVETAFHPDRIELLIEGGEFTHSR